MKGYEQYISKLREANPEVDFDRMLAQIKQRAGQKSFPWLAVLGVLLALTLIICLFLLF